MNKTDKQYIKEVVDHFVDMYKLDLKTYYKAYEIWFNQGLFSEIIIDFLQRVKISANTRLIKVSELPKSECGNSTQGCIFGLEINNQPLHFLSSDFRNRRFVIKIHRNCYKDFNVFITVLIHELSHLVLYSTYNKYRKSEVATDLFVMCFGLFSHMKSSGAENYITKEQIAFAKKYIKLKREYTQSSDFRRFLLEIQMKLL